MSKFNSQYKYMYDAAPEVALIAKDHVAHTATFNSTSIVLPKVQGWWNNPQFPADTVFAVVANVEALDHTTGDETYTIELEIGDAGYAHSQKTQKLVVTQPGQYAFLVDLDFAGKALGQPINELRLAVTLGGTTPSFTGHAFLGGAIVDGD